MTKILFVFANPRLTIFGFIATLLTWNVIGSWTDLSTLLLLATFVLLGLGLLSSAILKANSEGPNIVLEMLYFAGALLVSIICLSLIFFLHSNLK